ncbi:protein phosphatase regulator [Gnomoniopsis smithogilvyi]|uniref:Protein phosphatase regulator n=1 Tax=Gnomoniopsis smithogilvyi TaxID=1191159 RepID=A0A9W9CYB4_9PEZI|nr:protein phosphatase regulator [Gnomoniopsis smithogilvyi]
MARPGMIRADTIDLQDHDAPSAQNHPRPSPLQTNKSPAAANTGAVAPHQAETLREVAQETAQEELRSPRVSWANGGAESGDIHNHAEDLAAGVTNSLSGQPRNGYANDTGDDKMAARAQQDNLAVAQNGGLMSQDIADDGEMDGEESDLDDDMMDKISSSPSIDDGKVLNVLLRIEAKNFTEDNKIENDGLIFPYEGSTDEDDDDLFLQSTISEPRFIDSGWGATVEGQANATKGDAMVLLDDSNSYWWLVRVVKDSSIGYLPAEHIETPTERLARLNKHRNIDLSATMLGDQADKAKNSIKTAMRRRKTKNVSFAAPTYVDYSDYDYDTSDDEDEANNPFAQQQSTAQQQQQQQSQQASAGATQTNGDIASEDEAAKVAPLKPRGQQKTVQVVDPARSDAKDETSNKASRTSEEIFETNGVEGPKKKADGTVRDSFFKDDTVETKKITLTPNLLRDDGTVRESTDSIDKGIIKRPSFDKLEKELKEDKKKGKDKKEKDKKGGFRGLFSRKDKKQRDEDDDSLGKRSVDMGKDSMERPSEDVSPESSPGTPQRATSKLTKQQPRVEPSLARKVVGVPRETGNGMDLSAFLKDTSSVPPASMRVVDPDADLFEDDDDEAEVEKPQPVAAGRSASVDDTKPTAPAQARSRSQSVDDNKPSKPVKAVKPKPAKSRMQIEDSDTEEDMHELALSKTASSDRALAQPAAEPQQQAEAKLESNLQTAQPVQQKPQRPVLPGTFPDSYVSLVSNDSERTITADKLGEPKQRLDRLSESPIEVSPITPSESQPPPLTGDTSSQEEQSSPVSSPSPELIDREEAAGAHRNQDSITTSTSTTTVSSWNDTSLRAFFDSGADIRDLLVVVYDKTDVEPVGSDHPVAGALFKEQNAKLAEITTQLDNMLGDWLARKQRLRGTV